MATIRDALVANRRQYKARKAAPPPKILATGNQDKYLILSLDGGGQSNFDSI